MQILIGEYKWRDRILLLVSWGTLFFTATANWAAKGLPMQITELSSRGYWQAIAPYVYTILPFVLLLIPFLVWVVSYIVPSFPFSKAIDKFQRQEIFWGLVFTFNLGLVSLISQRFRYSLLTEFLLISLVVVIILWLFYRRASFDISKMILCATLWTAIIIIRQTLPLLQGRIDFDAASWYTKVYILLLVIPFLGSVFLPFIVLLDRRRGITTTLQKLFQRIPVGIWAVIFVLASLWTFGFFWTMENEIIGVMAMRIGAVAITFSAGGMLIWVFGGESRRDANEVLPLGKTCYAILLSLLLAIYVVLAFRIGANNLESINPDGLSYLDIAREYAQGNAVVRGYWSPLISWLISPLIMLGVNPHASFQILNGLVGFGWILLALLLAKRARLKYIGCLALTVTMIVVVLSYGFTLVTPDILGSLFIGLYFYWITNPAVERMPVWIGIAIGLSGALAYLAKYYNLPFVLAHMLLTTFLFIIHRKKIRIVAISIVTSLCIMMICISPWIITLYHRYGYFTLTTSGAISRAIVGPDAIIHSCWSGQLCDQPTDALAPWEDPQFQYYPSYGWSPFQSLENFRHQILLMKNNIWYWTSSTLFELGPLLPFAVLTITLAVLIHWGDVKRRLWYSWIFLTSLLYVSGYMFTFSTAFRYYFPILPILFIVGYSSLQRMFFRAEEKLSQDKRLWLRSFMVILFAVSILSLGKLDLIKYFLINRNDPCLRDASLVVKDYLEGPIAGTDVRSNYIAYYTQIRTLGVLPPGYTAEEVDVLLHEYGVRTYIVSDELDLKTALVSQYFYSPLLDTQICGDGYTVLRVPD
jgi:4-amino-4-deoxy-L-arabinose transferase-like glycosyltransferase